MSSEQTDWTSKKLLNWMRDRFEASGLDAPRVVAKRSWRKRSIAADWNCTCIPSVPRLVMNAIVCGIKSAVFCR